MLIKPKGLAHVRQVSHHGTASPALNFLDGIFCVALIDLEFIILLSQPPKCYNYKLVPLHLVRTNFFFYIYLFIWGALMAWRTCDSQRTICKSWLILGMTLRSLLGLATCLCTHGAISLVRNCFSIAVLWAPKSETLGLAD